MSAHRGKADIPPQGRDFRFWPIRHQVAAAGPIVCLFSLAAPAQNARFCTLRVFQLNLLIT